MPPFQVGDVVRLKSGGPPMTVVSPDTDGRVLCSWFIELGTPEVWSFPPECLDPVSTGEPVSPDVTSENAAERPAL